MLRTFKITVDGKPYTVTVEDVTEGEGRLYPEPGLGMAPATPAATAAPPPPAAPSAAPTGAAAGPGDEVSPLAGVVESLEVAVGQAVSEGDHLLTIEAMKMKTKVVAHHSGSVSNIAVKAGDAVDAGQVLLTIS